MTAGMHGHCCTFVYWQALFTRFYNLAFPYLKEDDAEGN